MKNVLSTTKFPENRKIKEKLQTGDTKIIAEYSGLSATSIRDILNGRRRMTDKVMKAIIRLYNERQELSKAIENIIEEG